MAEYEGQTAEPEKQVKSVENHETAEPQNVSVDREKIEKKSKLEEKSDQSFKIERKKRRPWEPEERTKEQKESDLKKHKKETEKKNRKEKREKRVTGLIKLPDTLETYRKNNPAKFALSLVVSFVVLLALILGAIFGIKAIIDANRPAEEEPGETFEWYGNMKDSTVLQYWDYVTQTLIDAAYVDVDKNLESDKIFIKQNINRAVYQVENEYERMYFKIGEIAVLSMLGFTENALDKMMMLGDYNYDERQTYCLYTAYRIYYRAIGDKDRYNYYSDRVFEYSEDDLNDASWGYNKGEDDEV